MHNSVDERVNHYARVSPGRAAVADGAFVLTYGELAELSGALAARLREAGIAAGDLVVLDCARGASSIAAMMAVLTIRAIFAPLDPSDPAARRDLILRQSRPVAIVTSRGQSLAADSFELTACSWDESPQAIATSDPADPGAYVMFTSGSTGQPKGALIGHRAILNLVGEPRFGLTPGVVVAHCANQAFDISTLEIWGALCNGGTVVPLATSKLIDPAALRSVLDVGQVDVMVLTTAVFNHLADIDPTVFAPLKRLVFGGERASADHISAVLAASHGGGPVLLNSYGPTEATVSVVVAELVEGGYGSDVPIGTPLQNVGCHLLDEGYQHTDSGELYLSGACLAHGYWRDPQATSSSFVEIEVGGKRVMAYRTGDICRLNDGQLYFSGRRDTMVKLRGHRIELGEVEMALAREPEVSEVCVLMMDSSNGPELVAFVRAYGDIPLARLRKSAGQVLPHYMLPSRLVQVDSMPLNTSGKIDRARLHQIGLV